MVPPANKNLAASKMTPSHSPKTAFSKSADDLLALIPLAGEPILKADLLAQARAAGIGRDSARRFLNILKRTHLIRIVKVRRPKKKSAIGYVRVRSTRKDVEILPAKMPDNE